MSHTDWSVLLCEWVLQAAASYCSVVICPAGGGIHTRRLKSAAEEDPRVLLLNDGGSRVAVGSGIPAGRTESARAAQSAGPHECVRPTAPLTWSRATLKPWRWCTGHTRWACVSVCVWEREKVIDINRASAALAKS